MLFHRINNGDIVVVSITHGCCVYIYGFGFINFFSADKRNAINNFVNEIHFMDFHSIVICCTFLRPHRNNNKMLMLEKATKLRALGGAN